MSIPSLNGFEATPRLETYTKQREAEFDEISVERRDALDQLSQYISQRVAEGAPIRLIFICTHNSRRSQFAQVWSALAATRNGIDNVTTYSGGTEATAFNIRSIEALRRAGWKVGGSSFSANPRYLVRHHTSAAGWECFSKIYNEFPNPSSGFCAVMTCSDADEACPTVLGADKRIALPYADPRLFDDKPEETLQYDLICRQVAREMLYVFSHVQRTN